MTTDYPIEEFPIPESVNAPDAEGFRAFIDILNATNAEAMGEAGDHFLPEEALPGMQDHTFSTTRLFGVRQGGQVVAVAAYSWTSEPGTRTTWPDVRVRAEHRNHGIGSALIEHVETLARADGRPVLQGGGHHLPTEGPLIESPTGFGSVPGNDDTARFLGNRGWSLEQVYRVSALALPIPADEVQAHLDQAIAKAGPDYRVHTWVSPSPERWLADLAEIFTRMATDAPSGNLEIDPEPWDADRVRENDQRRLKAGRTQLVAAVEHIPTGKLVAFNGVSVGEDRARPAHQGITLVLKEHRGHKLGMLTKIANIQQIQEFSPQTRSIITDNAEENRPMLDVNEAVGFTPIAYQGVWKKVLEPESPDTPIDTDRAT